MTIKLILRNLFGIVTITISMFFLNSCSSNQKPKELNTIFFSTEISEDATLTVSQKILELQNKPDSKIIFEKGEYHFYPNKGVEKFVYISNHCDLMVNTAFPIDGFKGLTVDGQGSTFIFHGVMIPFLVNQSDNIHVKNLTVDWKNSFHSEGKIVATNEKNKSFDMAISKDFPYEIRNEQIYFIKPYYEHTLGQSILYDTLRKAIAFNTEAYTDITSKGKTKHRFKKDNIKYKYDHDERAPEYKDIGHEYKIKAVQLKPGLVRIYNHRKKLPPIGTILTMKGEQGVNRVSPAFRVTHSTNFNATNVNIHHAGGMGIIAENSSNLTLDNFNITPSKGRMVSTTADATHFVGCSGKVTLKNCTFQNQLDDALNVHGTYQKIVDILGKNKIGVRMMHHQQKGFTIGKPTENIGFVRLENSFFPYKKNKIKQIEYVNSRYQIITFQSKLPNDLKVGDLIENLDGYPELLVQNCNISNNRARGLLISNPVKTIIENNFFSTEMEALLIPVESGYWYESGNAVNLIIRNNTFQDCQHSGFNRGVIRFVTDDDNENIAFKNIEITGNQFNHFDNLLLEIANTDGLLFKNNTITNSNTFPKLYPENPAIRIKSSKNIVFKNNNYQGTVPKNKIIDVKENDTQIRFE
ncbi:right-handed parallel beta-helix repeat-containing protein [Flavicella marina]|uniref:right-handed parallel beta-helix repeat-containing protein n=1 Tax=Flavicella marina TaxID=1475951 RepID=UPI00186B3F66|nr:right-handed parallel beta-helix repeat-containing protein [Flavicella marina]